MDWALRVVAGGVHVGARRRRPWVAGRWIHGCSVASFPSFRDRASIESPVNPHRYSEDVLRTSAVDRGDSRYFRAPPLLERLLSDVVRYAHSYARLDGLRKAPHYRGFHPYRKAHGVRPSRFSACGWMVV